MEAQDRKGDCRGEGEPVTDWPDGWFEPTGDERTRLVRELHKELGDAHVLKGATVRLLATRDDCDDALFALDDGRVAQVHLTYAPTPERNPVFPATKLHESLETWRTHWINDIAPFC